MHVAGYREASAPSKYAYACYVIGAVALISAFGLSIVSWLRLCSQACSEGHNYRLFGFTFETVGMTFFPILIAMHFLSRKIQVFASLVGWLICASLGSEIMFIYVQKYKIGSWCPVCLSIAASLAIAGAAYFVQYYSHLKQSLEQRDKDYMMNTICKGCTGIIFFVMGFILAFTGIGKFNQLQAAEKDVKDSIAFGNLKSPIEVYIFTDWACHGCRELEPQLEDISNAIMSKARLTFVDDPVHPDTTMNYTPYNVSFMVHDKPRYFALRQALTELSEDTKAPTDAQIEALAAKTGVRYQQLNYADVALASKYFKQLIKKLEVEGTPTLVIVNTQNKKGKKLEGISEITKENILKAIESLSSGSR